MGGQGFLAFHGTVLIATIYSVQGQEYCEGKTFWCDKGHCCGRGKCCAYYYELWWFWLIWALIILLSCCCLYQQKRFRHRRNQSRRRTRGRNTNRSRIAQAFDAAFITPIFDPDRVRLPTYDEAKDLPKDPPPYDVLYETGLPETSVNTSQTPAARNINEAPQASLIENEEHTAEATSPWTEPPPPYTPTSPPISPTVTSPPYTPFPPVPSSSGLRSNSTSSPSLPLPRAQVSPPPNLPSVPVMPENSHGQRRHKNVKGERPCEDGLSQLTTPKEVCANRPLQRTRGVQRQWSSEMDTSTQRSSGTNSSMQRSSAGIQGQISGAENLNSHYGASELRQEASSSVQGSSSTSANVPTLSVGLSTSTSRHNSAAINSPTHTFVTSNPDSQTSVVSRSITLPSVTPPPSLEELTDKPKDNI